MKENLFTLFSVFAVLLAIETALYRYIKKKNAQSAQKNGKKIKQGVIFHLVVFALFSGYLYFFEERSSYLECHKDTMTCRYFHTTYSNNKIRLVKTYDISRVISAKMKKHYRRRSPSYYTVELIEENGGFDLPIQHCYRGGAQKEAKRFNRFLRGEKKQYIFRKNPSSDSFGTVIGFMGCLFAIFLETGLFWDLLVSAFKEREKVKCRNKENIPVSDDVIQRRR